MSAAEFSSVELGKSADSRPEENKFTILLAEDERSLRQMLSLILQEAGYHLITAEDGDQALQLAKKYSGRIDMLVSDIEMPGINGPDLAKKLLRSRCCLKIMLMSGGVPALEAFESEWRFLPKPFAPSRLLEEVRVALD